MRSPTSIRASSSRFRPARSRRQIARSQDALDVIQQATEEGARLFAPDEIGQAIRLREQGVAQRKDGRWAEAIRLADEASTTAAQALALALEQRDAAAEALLSDRQGSVEGQRPQELLWTDRTLNAILIEQEKVRTLSRSTAQITFRDESRLRLNANSQALIQRMRLDPLSREEEAKVSLVEGDFYALLAGKSQRKNFELEVPEVETQIEFDQFLGAAGQQRLQVHQLRRARPAGVGARARAWTSAATRRRWCAAARRRPTRSTFCHGLPWWGRRTMKWRSMRRSS